MLGFRKFAPPTCKQVETALKNMGFESTKQKGTSHVHWEKVTNGQLFKVTVDCPKAPFSDDLVNSMAKQAGVTKNKFLLFCHDKKQKSRIF